jgi:hypothetical protein
MELLGDLFTLFLLCAVVYAFVPDVVKNTLRSGLGPVVSAMANALRAVLPVVEQIAYRLIVGRPRIPATQLATSSAEHYVADSDSEDKSESVQKSAFTNAGTNGSSAFRSGGTERTPEAEPEPAVHLDQLDAPDLALIVQALERRGYLCLDQSEQGIARDLVYRIERQARFAPAGQRSKSNAIQEATGLKRGGSAGYKRASAIYDGIIGQPPPAVVKSEPQETVKA